MRSSRFCLGLALVAVTFARPAEAANDLGAPQQWGMRTIGAEAAWTVSTGRGMTIAIVDTGVDPDHEDLRGKVLPGRNFVTDGAPAHDDNGHGTHVAGIAAALTNNRLGVVGVAPDARILPVKVLNADGSGAVGDLTDVPRGIHWAADNGAQVINVSLGIGRVSVNRTAITATGPALVEAVQYAWAKGAIVVISAGNDESATNLFGEEPAIVVTATDDDDRKAPYATNVGRARWGMAAPGGAGEGPAQENILSTIWTSGSHDKYTWMAGTSMAAPHVAGAAAVVRANGLSPSQAVDRLLATSKDLGGAGRDSVFGAGRLDLAHALGLPPTAPQQVANTGTATSTTVSGGRRPSTGAGAGTGSGPGGARVGTGNGGGLVPGGGPADPTLPAGGLGTLNPEQSLDGLGEPLSLDDASEDDEGGGGGAGSRPWAGSALAACLLAVAARGIVRARRA